MISIILPVYRNADFLEELIRRLHRALDDTSEAHEVIAVNDSCPANSLAVLQALVQHDPRLIVVDLKQNIGQHRAVLTGLTYATGDWFGTMDADLQDQPEVVPLLLDLAMKHQAVVFAGRRGRYQSATRLLTSRLFKYLIAVLAGIPRDAGLFFVAPGEMKPLLLGMNPRRPFVQAMMGATPIPKMSLPTERDRRPSGTSSYSSWARLKAGFRAVSCASQCRFASSSIQAPDYGSLVRSVMRGSTLPS